MQIHIGWKFPFKLHGTTTATRAAGCCSLTQQTKISLLYRFWILNPKPQTQKSQNLCPGSHQKRRGERQLPRQSVKIFLGIGFVGWLNTEHSKFVSAAIGLAPDKNFYWNKGTRFSLYSFHLHINRFCHDIHDYHQTTKDPLISSSALPYRISIISDPYVYQAILSGIDSNSNLKIVIEGTRITRIQVMSLAQLFYGIWAIHGPNKVCWAVTGSQQGTWYLKWTQQLSELITDTRHCVQKRISR